MLTQRPPRARVPASATAACPAQGWRTPPVIWSWREVGECSVAGQTGVVVGLCPLWGLGLQINVPGVGVGGHRGATPPPYSSGSQAGSSGSAFQGGKMTHGREALLHACGHSFVPQMSTSTRGCGGTAGSEAGRAGARGEPLGT